MTKKYDATRDAWFNHDLAAQMPFDDDEEGERVVE